MPEFPQSGRSDRNCGIAVSKTRRSPCQTGLQPLSFLHIILSKFAFNSASLHMLGRLLVQFVDLVLNFIICIVRLLHFRINSSTTFSSFDSFTRTGCRISGQRICIAYRARPNLVLLFPKSAWSSSSSGARMDTCANFPSSGLPAFQGANTKENEGVFCKGTKTKLLRANARQSKMTNKQGDNNQPITNHAINFTRRPIMFDPGTRRLSKSNNQTQRKLNNDLRPNPIPSYQQQRRNKEHQSHQCLQ